MLAHGLKSTFAEKGLDYPFVHVRPLLSKADVVFGNLENPISTRAVARYPGKEYHFLMDPPHTAALKRAGFRVMSLANNHILDFGTEALMDTIGHLEKEGIVPCGAGGTLAEARRPAVVAIKGRTIAFLAYARTFPLSFSATPETPGTAFADEAFIIEDVARAKREHTWVIVSFHWGEEYHRSPSPAHRRLARAAVDAGA
ncbi:MAG: CapA family protein, partial [Elusimicrobia bacterium]|nr:CapA family protein [Elusimicrobiota bacterium]